MPYYDKETIRAVSDIGLLEYLEHTEPNELVRQGSERYTMRSHDSLSISDGKWYWFSRGVGGRNALTYLIKVKGLSFQEAVAELLRFDNLVPARSSNNCVRHERRQLKLPLKAPDNDNARAYLMKRGIRADVADEQFESGAIYESQYTFKNSGRVQAQIVFLGFDESETARYANIRSIDGKFKGDAEGSDKRFPFAIKSEYPSATLRVFESAIDVLSFASAIRHECSDYSTMHMISLGGVQPPGEEAHLPPALKYVLDICPDIRRIALNLDNDIAGREAAKAIGSVLEAKGFEVIDAPPPKGKDYNDYLRISYGNNGKSPITYER